MKTWVVFVCFIGVSLAQDYIELRPYNVTAENLFYSSDLNGNGLFDRGELNGVFEVYDVNHDNRVARHEYLHLISPALYNFAVILFDDYDCAVPPDGFVEDRDFDVYYGIMDGNSDGMVDRNEFIDHWILVLEKMNTSTDLLALWRQLYHESYTDRLITWIKSSTCIPCGVVFIFPV